MPAAGLGSRYAGPQPKQYEAIGGRPILSWSLEALLGLPWLKGVCVALNPDDYRFAALPEAADGRVTPCAGGETRQASVVAALQALLAGGADATDQVLVHDAARPGLTGELARALIDRVGDDADGGLLALPVGDTLKRGDGASRVEATVPRDGLWAAQTPQLFQLGLLLTALESAQAEGTTVTDEASAMEARGYRPRLVPGSFRNLKVTYPSDRELLESVLMAAHG